MTKMVRFLVAAETASEEQKPELWFLSLKDRRWIKNPEPAPGGVSTREALYVPDHDAILAYGPAREGDPVWTVRFFRTDAGIVSHFRKTVTALKRR